MPSIKDRKEEFLAQTQADLLARRTDLLRQEHELNGSWESYAQELKELEQIASTLGAELNPILFSKNGSGPVFKQSKPSDPVTVSDELIKPFRAWLYEDRDREFTTSDVEQALKLSSQTARKRVKRALDLGWIEDTGKKIRKEGVSKGPGMTVYRYSQKVEETFKPRPKQMTPEEEARRDAPPIASPGRAKLPRRWKKFRSQNKDMNKILERCESLGCKVEMRGNDHLAVVRPDGRYVTVSNSPRSSSVDKVKSELKRNGIDLRNNKLDLSVLPKQAKAGSG